MKVTKVEKKSLIRFLIVSLLLIITASAPCNTPLPKDNLQTGTISFTSMSMSPYCISVPIAFSVPLTGYKSAVCTPYPYSALYRIGQSSFPNGIDFEITASSGMGPNASFTLITNIDFVSAEASYIITANPGLLLGSFIMDTSTSFDCPDSPGLTTFIGSMFFPTLSNYIDSDILDTEVFISGIKASTYPMSISYATIPSLRKGLLTVSVTLSSNSIEFLKLSCVVVLTNSGLGVNKVDGVSSYSVYNWIGLLGYSSMGPKVQTFGIENSQFTCIGSPLCPPNTNNNNICLSRKSCVALNGVVVQSNCMICPPLYSYVGGTCMCDTDIAYAKSPNGVCTACWPNSHGVQNRTTCVCDFDFDKQTGYYQNPFNPYSCLQIPTCPADSVFNTQSQACVCTNVNMALVNNVCACPSNSQLNSLTLACECTAGNYPSSTNPVVCKANPCTGLNSYPDLSNPGACLTCRTSLVVNFNSPSFCSCPLRSYISLTTNQCVTIPTCCAATATNCLFNKVTGQCGCTVPTQVYSSATSSCSCPGSMTLLSGICICPSSSYIQAGNCQACWPNSHQNATKNGCDCDTGYFLTSPKNCKLGTSCTISGQVYNVSTQTCSCLIPGQLAAGNVCSCPGNQVVYLGTCVCPINSYLSAGACTACWANSVSSSNRTTCTCLKNFYLSAPSTCSPISTCSIPSTTFNIITGVCQCNAIGQTITNNVCTCPSGMQLNSAGSMCMCPKGSYFTNGACSNCWANAVEDNLRGTCVCDTGYYESAPQTCTKAPQQCQASSADLIQTGAVVFQPTPLSSSRHNCNQVALQIASPPYGYEHMATVLSFPGYPLGSPVDYIVTTKIVNSSTLSIDLEINNGWTSVNVAYMVSSSPYFFLGYLDVGTILRYLDTSLSYRCGLSGNLVAEATQLVPRWSSNVVTQVTDTYVFISGFKSDLSTFSVEMLSYFNVSSGILSVRLNFSSTVNVAEFVRLSYMISQSGPFNVAPASWTAYSDYPFSGVSSLDVGTLVITPLSIVSTRLNCQGSGCTQGCIDRDTCVKSGGYIVGRNCWRCGTNQIFDSEHGRCTCNSNSISVGISCRACPTNSNADISTQVCACVDGFKKSGDVCVTDA